MYPVLARSSTQAAPANGTAIGFSIAMEMYHMFFPGSSMVNVLKYIVMSLDKSSARASRVSLDEFVRVCKLELAHVGLEYWMSVLT